MDAKTLNDLGQPSYRERRYYEAGREQGMREAAAIVHRRETVKEIAMRVRPYEPISAENVALLMEDCHDACVAIHLAILTAIGEGE